MASAVRFHQIAIPNCILRTRGIIVSLRKAQFYLAESCSSGMKCLFLIFPFAYLYTYVEIFVPSECGIYL
jgi:hypothetical protein